MKFRRFYAYILLSFFRSGTGRLYCITSAAFCVALFFPVAGQIPRECKVLQRVGAGVYKTSLIIQYNASGQVVYQCYRNYLDFYEGGVTDNITRFIYRDTLLIEEVSAYDDRYLLEDSARWLYFYDPMGHRVAMQVWFREQILSVDPAAFSWRKGIEVHYIYNAAGRLTRTHREEHGRKETTDIEYDDQGRINAVVTYKHRDTNRVVISREMHQYAMEYHRIISIYFTEKGKQEDKTITEKWTDSLGRVMKEIFMDSAGVPLEQNIYTYNSRGLLGKHVWTGRKGDRKICHIYRYRYP